MCTCTCISFTKIYWFLTLKHLASLKAAFRKVNLQYREVIARRNAGNYLIICVIKGQIGKTGRGVGGGVGADRLCPLLHFLQVLNVCVCVCVCVCVGGGLASKYEQKKLPWEARLQLKVNVFWRSNIPKWKETSLHWRGFPSAPTPPPQLLPIRRYQVNCWPILVPE